MVKKGPNTDKNVEESLDSDTSRDSPVSKGEQYSPPKTNVTSGGIVEFLGDMPLHPGKNEGNAGSSTERKHQTHDSLSPKQSDIRAARHLKLTLSRRKTRQQLQKEQAAAMAIQAAWRGCQVRKEIDKMAKAATKIQATFRGHKIRKELPLNLSDHGTSKSKKKILARKESRSVPEFQSCFQQLDFTGTRTKSRSILPYNARSRSCMTVIGDYTLLNPEVTFLEIATGCRPCNEMFTCSSLNVLGTEIEWQRYHNAAIIIQAAWRGYQVRKMIGITVQPEESHSESFSFNYVCEEIIRKETISDQPSKFQGRRPDTVLLGFVPRIRNINIYTVVKEVPASQRPNISIRVLSPNAVIQGYQRELSVGVQGLYTIKSPGALRPSQLFVRVDLRKELKKLSSLLTEKNPKPKRRKSTAV